MSFEHFFDSWAWIYICGCLPLTILTMCGLFYVVRTDHVPVIYYTILLVSNLIQISIIIAFKAKNNNSGVILLIISILTVMAAVSFRTLIALERCFAITFPQWQCIRQTKGSVLLCVGAWVLCAVVSSPMFFVSDLLFYLLPVFLLLPVPVFIFCLARTITALPAATVMPAEEKRRTLAILVLLLLQHTLLFCPLIIWVIIGIVLNVSAPFYVSMFIASCFLLCPFVDLILIVFMPKGPISKLLAPLCCCKMDNSEEADAAETTV